MKSVSFERVLIVLALIASGFGYSSFPLVLAVLGLLGSDTFKFYLANKKQDEATKAQVEELSDKFKALEKTVNEKANLMDNKLAGLGLIKRNV